MVFIQTLPSKKLESFHLFSNKFLCQLNYGQFRETSYLTLNLWRKISPDLLLHHFFPFLSQKYYHKLGTPARSVGFFGFFEGIFFRFYFERLFSSWDKRYPLSWLQKKKKCRLKSLKQHLQCQERRKWQNKKMLSSI